MWKLKTKPASKKSSTVIKRVGEQLMITETPKEEQKANNKLKTPAKKIVYTSKGGSKAIFDSINLIALVFGVNSASVRNMIGRIRVRKRKDDWLKGGSIEYFNN